ncbi:MAG: Uma2 family endonuclease [Synechococcus sp.]|nr:Uma2 family endonuclease [Synechococcus sp.]
MVTLPAAPSRPAELGLPCELTLPRELSEQLRFTPEQFAQLCEANPEAVLELSAEGHLITMTPTGGDTSLRNNALSWQLGQWARSQGGWIVFDSSGGFRLSDGSVLSPDASLVRQERWQALTPEQRRGFPPLCPDLVVELASPSDEGPRGISALRRKMGHYIAGGARIGWLISPEQRSVEIWRGCGVPAPASAVNAAMESERLEEPSALEGGDDFPELRLELAEIWAV